MMMSILRLDLKIQKSQVKNIVNAIRDLNDMLPESEDEKIEDENIDNVVSNIKILVTDYQNRLKSDKNLQNRLVSSLTEPTASSLSLPTPFIGYSSPKCRIKLLHKLQERELLQRPIQNLRQPRA